MNVDWASCVQEVQTKNFGKGKIETYTKLLANVSSPKKFGEASRGCPSEVSFLSE